MIIVDNKYIQVYKFIHQETSNEFISIANSDEDACKELESKGFNLNDWKLHNEFIKI